jgi:hypothetical protein
VSDGRVQVAAFRSGYETEAAASLLRANGIEVEVAPFDPGGVRAFLHQPAPGRLLVAPADAERAREVLAMAESGAYEEAIEELPEAQAPDEPVHQQDIDAGLRSIARLRTLTVCAGIGAMAVPIVAVVLGSEPSTVAILAVMGWIVFIILRARVHFVRCPRCAMRIHATLAKRGFADTCTSCGLTLS